MAFALLYSCLRLLLDLVDVRLRTRDHESELLLLRHELRVLRRQVKQPHLLPTDRLILAALARCDRRSALVGLVQPETILGWHRELVRRKWSAFGRRRGAGRPPLPPEVRALILAMARENPRWGCIRIRGELLKVGHRVSATAIRNLLRRERIGPAPHRAGLTWRRFLKAQASSIVLTDFFSVDTLLLRRLYVLVYMELASRRIAWLAITDHPDTAWVAQQARNLVWELADEQSGVRFLVHDHDANFAPAADAVFTAEGVAVIKTPIAAPKANAHMERQIGSTRRECLDWMLILNRRQLERVLDAWVDYYNEERPHRGLGLRTPIARSDPVAGAGPVRCRRRLGGLLQSYTRSPEGDEAPGLVDFLERADE